MYKHWIWLTMRKGVGYVGCKKLLSVFHTAEAIYDLTATELQNSGLKNMGRNWIDSLLDKDLSEAERIERDCEKYGIKIIAYNDAIYPHRLKEIYDPPCVLYCKGTMPMIDNEVAIGVVGTRRCTNYGLILTKQFSSMIALSGGVVVSGGARGIDTMALQGAMDSYKPVVCVLPGGLDEYYPRENRKLFDDITRQGCLLSEIPPGGRPVPNYFIARNRLISGLSLGVLVVEAPMGSGALSTAELALSQNRDVFTVQREDSGYYNQGNEELIRAGCEVVEDGWALLSRYASAYPHCLRDGRGREAMQLQCQKQYGMPVSYVANPPREEPKPAVQKSKRPSILRSGETSGNKCSNMEDGLQDLPETERKVLAVFGRDPMEMDEIIIKSGMEATAVITALTMLQIKKRIIKCFGNSYQRI